MGMSIYTHKTKVLSQHSSQHNIGSEDKPKGLTILSPMDQVRSSMLDTYLVTSFDGCVKSFNEENKLHLLRAKYLVTRLFIEPHSFCTSTEG